MGEKILIATGNKGKLREFARMLAPLGYEAVPPQEAGMESLDVLEDGTTFAENAYKKARAYSKASGLPALADDSGLEVDALGGAPGIYTARYGGEGLTDRQRLEKLLEAMAGQTERGAQFVCALCLYWSEGKTLTAQGVCRGEIAHAPVGEDGFGYDPIFLVPEGSFAQIPPEMKDARSHRGKALEKLRQKLAERDKHGETER